MKMGNVEEAAYTEDGVHINSDFLNGLGKQEAIDKMIDWLSEKGLGEKKVNYRLREWIFARVNVLQLIPVVNYEDRSEVLDDSELPLNLPKLDDYSPSKSGESPLNKAVDWVNYKGGKRETVQCREVQAAGIT